MKKGAKHSKQTIARIKETKRLNPPKSKGLPGRKLSEETKQKIRIARVKQVFSAETRAKMSAARMGKPIVRTEEGRASIIAAANARKGKPSGYKHDAEARRKIGEASRNRSAECNKRIADANRNRSPEQKKRIRESRPPITDETRAKLAKAARDRSAEISERFIKSNTGIIRSEETCLKLSLTHRGKKLSTESILKRELTRKGGNGKIYEKID